MILPSPEKVIFDASNKAHRIAVHAFMKRGAWADSPIRFAHDPEYGSVAEQVKSKLLEWYVAQEEKKFNRPPSKLRQRVSNARVIQDTPAEEILQLAGAKS